MGYRELQEWEDLIEAATRTRQNAYALYSKFRVGAAVRTVDGRIFAGCNVENASYGLTCCAERNAIFRMVATIGEAKIMRVCVALKGGGETGGSPCGACRQVLWEFASSPHTDILMIDPEGGGYRLATIGELLPDAFVLK